MTASPTTFPRLLADVGGTHARFARQLAAGQPLQDVATYKCAEFPSLQAVMERYIAERALREPHSCAIGIANPVMGDHVQMTNLPWAFSIRQMQQALGLKRLLVINDFSALALALPLLQPAELRQVGPGSAAPDAAIGLIGAGTGLGVGGLLHSLRGEQVPLSGEGGHVSLAPVDEREFAVVAWLHRRYGHASSERALSGPGLVNLYHALCELRGEPVDAAFDGAKVAHAGASGESAAAAEAVAMFCALLGSVAGNLALTLGARGGIYIGGGIVPKLGEVFDRSRFRERFEAKGRFAAYLRAIPTLVIDTPTSPALSGASRALDLAS